MPAAAMSGARLAAAVALLLMPRPPALEAPSATSYASVADALAVVMHGAPQVLGVGELHQTVATLAIPSSLARFTREIWPLIAARASDLIVETWVTDGRCGATEAAAVASVAETIQRPAGTESEIVTLLGLAREAGVRPHILRVSCADYRLLSPPAQRPGGGAVDFQRMLALIELHLREQITQVLAERAADAGAGASAGDKLVVVYGGALHNDLHPNPALAIFSYGVPMFRATNGRYRELDLYVPEYIERNPAMRREPWFPAWQRAARPGRITVLRRSAESFILIFPHL